MTVTVLGSGTSHGIPVIKCGCPVCKSNDKHDIRRRASILVEENEGAAQAGSVTTVKDGITVRKAAPANSGAVILVDAGCDFRMQMIEAKVNRLDAVFLTHSHADHLHGLDDIRPLTWDGTVPVYANALTIDELRTRFDYIFKETQKGGGKPDIRTEVISGTLSIGGISIESVPVMHGTLVILAYIFTHGSNSLAYITDCSGLPSGSENTIKKLAACQTLILGALRKREHQTHFSFDQAFDFARELYQAGGNLRRVYLTHISHETSHKKITAYCNEFLRSTPALRGLSIAPAYDMQKIIPDEI